MVRITDHPDMTAAVYHGLSKKSMKKAYVNSWLQSACLFTQSDLQLCGKTMPLVSVSQMSAL